MLKLIYIYQYELFNCFGHIHTYIHNYVYHALRIVGGLAANHYLLSIKFGRIALLQNITGVTTYLFIA